MTTPLTLFASYAHKDGRHRDALGAHLAGLERQGILREWHDGDIVPGTEWSAAITEKLEQAEIIVHSSAPTSSRPISAGA